MVNKLEGSRVDSPSTKDDVYGDESHMPTFTLFLGFHLMPKLYNGGHNFAPRPETFMNWAKTHEAHYVEATRPV